MLKKINELEDLVDIRNLREIDYNFIYNSWLESYRNEEFCKGLANDVYYSGHHKIIENLLEKAHTLIVCSKEEPSFIVGWINFDNFCPGIPIIHYMFIKHQFRKQGLASALIKQVLGKDKELIISHKRKGFTELLKNEDILIYYSPYEMFK